MDAVSNSLANNLSTVRTTLDNEVLAMSHRVLSFHVAIDIQVFVEQITHRNERHGSNF